MAKDKKIEKPEAVKIEKPEREHGKRDDVMEAIYDQVIHEFIQPLIHQVPEGMRTFLKAVKADKLLPIVAIGLNAMLPQTKSALSDKLGVAISEGSAELGRFIREGKVDTPEGKEVARRLLLNLNNVILNLALDKSSLVAVMVAYSELFLKADGTERKGKELESVQQILELLDQKQLTTLLTQFDKEQRRMFIRLNPMFKPSKDKKTFEQVVVDLKQDMDTFFQEMEIVKAQVLMPLYDKAKGKIGEFDNLFVPGSKIRKKTAEGKGLLDSAIEWSERFRERQKTS